MKKSVTPFDILSGNHMKLVRSLRQKKHREANRMFIAEGDKIVREYLEASHSGRCSIRFLCATQDWIERYGELSKQAGAKIYLADYPVIRRISSLVTPQEVLAVVNMAPAEFDPSVLQNRVTLAFQSIRDPGNLGTIIRTTDWFGIETIVCSPDSVDVFNPKVIQSAMGSTIRVNVYYLDLIPLLTEAKRSGILRFGTFLEGEDLYETEIPKAALILFGNESSGIGAPVSEGLDRKISIPSSIHSEKRAESLNLAASVAVVISEIKRRERSGYSK